MEETEAEFEGKGYGVFKSAVADAVVAALEPIQNRYAELTASRDYLEDVYRSGAQIAERTAFKTIAKVYRKVGFIQP